MEEGSSPQWGPSCSACAHKGRKKNQAGSRRRRPHAGSTEKAGAPQIDTQGNQTGMVPSSFKCYPRVAHKGLPHWNGSSLLQILPSVISDKKAKTSKQMLRTTMTKKSVPTASCSLSQGVTIRFPRDYPLLSRVERLYLSGYLAANESIRNQ